MFYVHGSGISLPAQFLDYFKLPPQQNPRPAPLASLPGHPRLLGDDGYLVMRQLAAVLAWRRTVFIRYNNMRPWHVPHPQEFCSDKSILRHYQYSRNVKLLQSIACTYPTGAVPSLVGNSTLILLYSYPGITRMLEKAGVFGCRKSTPGS